MKNTILSLIRHGLTAGGTALALKYNLGDLDVPAVVGAILAVIGAFWGAKDEHKAENAAK